MLSKVKISVSSLQVYPRECIINPDYDFSYKKATSWTFTHFGITTYYLDLLFNNTVKCRIKFSFSLVKNALFEACL